MMVAQEHLIVSCYVQGLSCSSPHSSRPLLIQLVTYSITRGVSQG
jgi:hypothetical protein